MLLMKKCKIVALAKVLILCVILSACQGTGIPEEGQVEISNEQEVENTESIENADSSSEAEPVNHTGNYQMFPEDMSAYGDKTILHFGILNFISAVHTPAQNQMENLNQYLIEQGSPYVVQLVGCIDREQSYNAAMLAEAEKELGYSFDVLCYLRHPLSAEDIESYMEPLDAYMQKELLPLYEARPQKYWELARDNGVLYNLYERTYFYSLGCQYIKSYPSQKDIISEEFLDEMESSASLAESFACIQEMLQSHRTSYWAGPSGGITYLQNKMVSIPFSSWQTEAYFASVAPLVGMDFISGQDEIISLLDSDTFQLITDQYRKAHQSGQTSCTLGSNMFQLTSWVNTDDNQDETLINVPLNQEIYFNPPYNEEQRYISIRKGSNQIPYALDLVLQLTTNQSMAEKFYMQDPTSVKEEADEYYDSSELNGLYLQCRLVNICTLLPQKNNLYADPQNLQDIIEQAQATPLTGFVFDMSPVSEEIQQIQSYLLTSETYKTIEGGKDWDHWETNLQQFQEELDALGFQKVIQEANRQYQAWKE